MARPLEYNATIVERVDLTDALSTFLILPDQSASAHGSPRGSTVCSDSTTRTTRNSARFVDNPRTDLSGWVLLHGASRVAELGYRQELLELSGTNYLRYWATISRPTEDSEWIGDVGRVETFFEPARLRDLERRLESAA
jgi:hypothetical protein